MASVFSSYNHEDAARAAANSQAVVAEFPSDYAAIRFRPKWLELYGKGVDAHEVSWQPQGIVLPAKA